MKNGNSESSAKFAHQAAKKGAQALFSSQEMAASLLESAADFVIGINPEGVIEYANRKAVEWVGTELLGTPMLRHIVSRHYRTVLHNFQKALDGIPTRPHEVELVNAEGAARWVEFSVGPHKDPQGRIIGVVAVLRDTMGRHAHMERLRLLGQTVMSVHEAVAIADPRGRLTFVNPAFMHTLGYDPNDAIGMRFVSLLSDNNPPGLSRELFQATRDGHFEGEVIMRRKDGSEFPAHVTTCVVRDEKGRGVASVGILRDVTQQKADAEAIARMNAELQQKNEELRQLSDFRSNMMALVAHDLKNPLHSIHGYTRMLLRGEVPPERSHQTLSRIADLAGNTTALVTSLLGLRQVETHQLETRLCDVRPIVVRAIDATIGDPEEGRHSVRVEGHFVPVQAHETLLYQILTNLLCNAVKYSPGGGDITIKACPIEDYLEISVQDTGLGIPQEMLDSVFEAYNRADRAAIRRIPGTGLGLNLVRTFVELQGGRIWAWSSEGEGSTFTFTVPLYQPPAQPHCEQPGAVEAVDAEIALP